MQKCGQYQFLYLSCILLSCSLLKQPHEQLSRKTSLGHKTITKVGNLFSLLQLVSHATLLPHHNILVLIKQKAPQLVAVSL